MRTLTAAELAALRDIYAWKYEGVLEQRRRIEAQCPAEAKTLADMGLILDTGHHKVVLTNKGKMLLDNIDKDAAKLEKWSKGK